jgi:DNA-binding CsgD family transcriptional regulator
VIRVRAGLAAGTAIDRIRVSRWLLAPLSTAGLWRRMVLWEIRSYPYALARERARVLARTALADEYGWRWRQTAPRRVRALYRLGQHPGQAPDTPPALTATPPDPATASPPDTATATRRPARRTPPKSGTATAVARLAARYPDMPTAAIAKRLDVSERTVRRYLAPARALPAAADRQHAA